MDQNEEQKYQEMRGEYIGLMAQLEHELTMLLVEYLRVQNHREDFEKWFVQASIPFSYKVTLLKRMEVENTIIETNFPDFWKDLYDLQKFRNTISHSFVTHRGMMTSRGEEIPETEITLKVLSGRLEKLRKLENLVLNMLVDEYEGVIPPISADDFADGPI